MGGLTEGTYTMDLRAGWENVKMVTRKNRSLGTIDIHAQLQFPHDCQGRGALVVLIIDFSASKNTPYTRIILF